MQHTPAVSAVGNDGGFANEEALKKKAPSCTDEACKAAMLEYYYIKSR